MIQLDLPLFEAAPAVKLELEAEILARLMPKIAVRGPDDCWLWLAGTFRRGYGAFHLNGKLLKAHRVMFELHHRLLLPGECALHSCDNPPCCNPAHLFAGTHGDNNADRDKKGRQAKGDATRPETRAKGDKNGTHTHPERLARGEHNGEAKLTEAKVVLIRVRYAAGGITLQELANEFAMGKSSIFRIVNGKNWTHV